MSVYIAAQLRIHDPERYERYMHGVAATLEGFDGEVVVADPSPVVVEGTWELDKFVLIRFGSADEARRWAASPAYRAIAVDREAATTTDSILVRGLDELPGGRRS